MKEDLLPRKKFSKAGVVSPRKMRDSKSVVKIIFELLTTLQKLSKKGYCHGRISPSHVFIDYQKLCRIVHVGFCEIKVIVEDFFVFSPPECLFGFLTPTTDVFSVGCLFWWLLYGNGSPFTSNEDFKLDHAFQQFCFLKSFSKISKEECIEIMTSFDVEHKNFLEFQKAVCFDKENLGFNFPNRECCNEVDTLISKMVRFDFKKRISLDECVECARSLLTGWGFPMRCSLKKRILRKHNFLRIRCYN